MIALLRGHVAGRRSVDSGSAVEYLVDVRGLQSRPTQQKEEGSMNFRSSTLYGLVAAVILAVPLVFTYIETGLVPRFPTAILATGMTIVAVLSFFAGLILDTVTRGRREMRRLAYLALPAPGSQL